MLGSEVLSGFGLGNQIFCYVSTRCLAQELGYEFSVLNREIFANNIHSKKGMYFMDLEYGPECSKEDFENVYHEKETRLFIGNSKHDLMHGCYIGGVDEDVWKVKDSTLVYGNLQDESYFKKYKEQIKEWLKVKPEYDCYEYSRENLCIINIRGGEYASNPELFLRREYWLNAMKEMKKKRADMEFMVVTDDVADAKRILPEVPAFHFELSKDYSVIKNAHYLILSNSSFAFFPAFTSETVKYIIAPKYWARHNVSDGYWASEQNIYEEFTYMDKKGRLFTAEECRKELAEYKKKSGTYKRLNKKKTGIAYGCAVCRYKAIRAISMLIRMCRSLKRRLKRLITQKEK